jgi:hypothetical protein
MELQERLLSLQKELSTPRQIAFYRIKLLEEEEEEEEKEENDDNNVNNHAGIPQPCLASLLVPLLKDSLTAWLLAAHQPIVPDDDNDGGAGDGDDAGAGAGELLSDWTETVNLRLILQLHLHVTKMNPSMGEELGRQGSHAPLVKLMNLDLAPYSGTGTSTGVDIDGDVNEANQDTVIELQDVACEIAALACSFPVPVAPFCAHGLRQRLPLVFSIGAVDVGVDVPVQFDLDSKTGGGADEFEYEKRSKGAKAPFTETVLIHQVTRRQSAQEDVGFGTYSTKKKI